jgi:hypothetical protein
MCKSVFITGLCFGLIQLADYYYFATARGRKIWWKKYLTSMQITQFIIDLFAVYFGSKFLLLSFPDMH